MLADPLSILYQDEWLVAVDKPAGQLVHPAGSPQEGDQVTMKILRDQIGQRVNSVHRLDRPTCGVLLFTKDCNSAQRMGQIFEKHSVRKIYWAVINGQPESAQWISRKSLKKDKHGICRTAETVFHVLEELDHELGRVDRAALVQIEFPISNLWTRGRTSGPGPQKSGSRHPGFFLLDQKKKGLPARFRADQDQIWSL